VLALDPATYQSVVLPGLRADAASKTPTAQPPVSELHVAIDRRLLQADPAKALVREQGLRRTVERLAPGDLSAIDNLNSALSRASRDAIMAKGLFLLLGLPGVLLAAAVARYAAGLLAEGQRRERALLRARGFGPAALRRSLALSTVVIGLGGTIVGLVVGGVAANALLPLSHVGGRSFVLSVVLAVVTAAATAAAAIYVPGRRSLVEEVADERRSMVEGKAPRWLVARADIALLLGSGIVALVAYFAGGYKVTAAASEGQSVALSFFFLLCPLFAWLGVTLLVARGLLGVAGRLGRRRGDSNLVGRLGRRTLSRSLIRRARPAVSGVCVIALATAFTVALAVFVTTYRHEQRVDARFVTGGDLRVALGATTNSRQDLESRLRVPGVTAVSPIASTPSAQVGNEKNLSFAGIDPTRFGQLQVLESGFSNQTTPSQALAALANDPNAVLMDRETAKTLNLHVGDVVRVDLPNVAQGRPISTRVRVAGIHIYFPGFPTGVDFIGNLSTFEKVTGAQVDSYGLRIAPGTDPRAVATALDAGPGRDLALRVDTTKTAINRDQSTIAALNLGSLGSLGRAFGLVLGATGAAVFVFGVLLTRRREHITLRALGLGLPKVAGIVLGEAAAVAGIALVVGTAIGVGMAAIDVQILRSLFVIPPHGLTAGVTGILGPTGIVVVGVALALIAGYAGLARSRLVEILRED
jgi:putative ABC transport system permease protein